MKKILFFGFFTTLALTLCFGQASFASAPLDYKNTNSIEKTRAYTFTKKQDYYSAHACAKCDNKHFFELFLSTIVMAPKNTNTPPTLINTEYFDTDAKYIAAMEKNIRIIDTTRQINQFISTASAFERIAKAEKDKWLPQYYIAYCHTRVALIAKDLNHVDEFGDKAENALNKAEKLSPNNSEIKVLRGFLALSRIKVDVMQRGMKYSSMAIQNLEEAIKLNPDNPRAYNVFATCMFNLPPQVGGSKEKACVFNSKAMDAFAKEQAHTDYSIAPHWGFPSAQYIHKNVCTAKEEINTNNK